MNATPARVRNRWGEGEQLRTEILQAASRLLSSIEGEDALTVRGIARAAGIAPASIYQHFADRAEVVRALLRFEFARLRTAMREADESLGEGEVVGRVRAQLRAYCAFAIENPGHYRLMLNSGTERTELLSDVLAMVAEGFVRCEAAGRALRLPSDRAAVLVVVSVHGRVALLHSSTARHSPQAIAEFVDELVSLVLA
ncbi:TetR family transcriptional regulator [Amycolatopsis bartoniae]|uniref:TetR family transcriptional regulator n=1 Tax=Amycolatopsis bartoniae TaxID=941986 RepID=A0A8H9M396_9PSEU|nr:TetR family transcriptional regulator [Amycolatopsis bartoniae]